MIARPRSFQIRHVLLLIASMAALSKLFVFSQQMAERRKLHLEWAAYCVSRRATYQGMIPRHTIVSELFGPYPDNLHLLTFAEQERVMSEGWNAQQQKADALSGYFQGMEQRFRNAASWHPWSVVTFDIPPSGLESAAHLENLDVQTHPPYTAVQP
jgi:hypothetical protein